VKRVRKLLYPVTYLLAYLHQKQQYHSNVVLTMQQHNLTSECATMRATRGQQ